MEYSQILKDLRRESATVRNRIQSIIFDAKYVAQFSEFPIVANERCGLWYVEPKNTAASVYFKSTDGHTGQWKFSLRRLNFHMLDLFQLSQTIVLVDSTRKGKIMPDALLKTVPMWCAVLNYIMFEKEDVDQWDELAKDNWLCTPPEMVSASEHSAMVKLIPEHAREVQKLGLVVKQELIQKLGAHKPLVPHWLYPGKKSRVSASDNQFSICCLTASRKTSSGTNVPGWHYTQPYVQGAADDHELWASPEICEGKLDHNLLWNEIYYEPADDLRVVDMATGDICLWLGEDEFLSRIEKIYTNSKSCKDTSAMDVSPLKNTGISIGAITQDLSFSEITKINDLISHIVVLSSEFAVTNVPKDSSVKIILHRVESSKKGSKQLREILPKIFETISTVSMQDQVIILCDSGKDLCVGLALAILAKYFDRDWNLVSSLPHVNKDVIKQHLCMVLSCRQVNPSRNTLQSVNTILM
ncbi:initiator tRNA phosphoribosyl transferase [Metschnikowia bicuspidata var. bicuspidata NRRL YB-4993]|uniref:Initiator tRNA phosphoribosyl transferase n=1 Tax=Metschnikowia bicuspidata var. bicuspidata NRRL YB-4993 TaxID=869754 RepID=A0A1A0HCV9_9ASCO|nr:initiator tRNA phosphoribosyl transferase [Metschnikowia bicuspidata var. bicuspidata NRRL YB-4993]OBA21846.1 initiator tRNA phosphoribosyl transferase [Metschnikowia bicuspidata var. bicuspidata NRRL YB-4993]